MNDFVPSIRVALYLVADEFDLDEVTHRLGIIPTETRTKDSFPPQSIAAGVAHTEWSVEIIEENCIAVCSLFKKLLSVLSGKEILITQVCDDYNLEAGFVVVIHMKDGDSPEVVLSREVVTFAALINAEIGFDIYCLE